MGQCHGLYAVIRYSSILVKFLLLASLNVVHMTVIIIIIIIIIIFFWKTLLKYRYCLLEI